LCDPGVLDGGVDVVLVHDELRPEHTPPDPLLEYGDHDREARKSPLLQLSIALVETVWSHGILAAVSTGRAPVVGHRAEMGTYCRI
jgi:hypothetical protein